MKLMPIVYVTDMDASITFYTTLGFTIGANGRSDYWTELTMGDAILALHYAETVPDNLIGQVELALVSTDPLEDLVKQLKTAGMVLEREISDETFGRSIQVCDPDGLIIQINEHT